jgi:hypothetical protein
MIIFGFGFLVGGLAGWLALGLLSLISHRRAILGDPKIVGESPQDVKSPEIFPQLRILRGGRGRPAFADQGRKAVS